jgi:hypothetical protein
MHRRSGINLEYVAALNRIRLRHTENRILFYILYDFLESQQKQTKINQNYFVTPLNGGAQTTTIDEGGSGWLRWRRSGRGAAMRLRTEKIAVSLGELLWRFFGKDLGDFGNNDDVTCFQPHLQKGLERRIHSSRSDVFRTDGKTCNYKKAYST